MKIVHICLGNPFTEEMAYKETYIIKANIEDGHDVLVIAPTLKWEGSKIVDTQEEDRIIYGGARLIRLKYDGLFGKYINSKIRKSQEIFKAINDFNPDVIVYQCIQSHSVQFLNKFKLKNPNIKIYGDVSTTYENSAKGYISKNILHKGIYRKWIKKSLNCFDKIFYVSDESKDFLIDAYKVPENMLEFNPLCGVLTTTEKKNQLRTKICREVGIKESDLIFLHAGKMDTAKKTIEVLKAFIKIKADNLKLIIAGEFYNEIKEEAIQIIKSDNRIHYVGFLTADKLEEYLNAVDVYVQPGSPSQTANTAICCFTPVVLANIPAYHPFYKENGWLINNVSQLDQIFSSIIKNPEQLKKMEKAAEKIAQEKLDYRKLAARLYQ